MSKAAKKITLPTTVLTTADSVEDIEDWLLAHSKTAVAELRALRKEHLAGKTRSLEEIKK